MNTFEPGDIFACHGTCRTSKIISWGTASVFPPRRLMVGPSHVGICCNHNGCPYLVESTSLCKHPCSFQGVHVRGVQSQIPEQRIKDYKDTGGRVDIYRLTDMDRLSSNEQDLLHTILFRYMIGKNYDTGGAIISGTKATKFLPLFGADVEALFCSELVASVLMRLNRLPRQNPTRFNPAYLLRKLVRQGTYGFLRSFS